MTEYTIVTIDLKYKDILYCDFYTDVYNKINLNRKQNQKSRYLTLTH